MAARSDTDAPAEAQVELPAGSGPFRIGGRSADVVVDPDALAGARIEFRGSTTDRPGSDEGAGSASSPGAARSGAGPLRGPSSDDGQPDGSNAHAARGSGGHWTIAPLENGPRILLNERALVAPRPLASGDRLRIGASEVDVVGAQGPLRLRWLTQGADTCPPDIAAPVAADGPGLRSARPTAPPGRASAAGGVDAIAARSYGAPAGPAPRGALEGDVVAPVEFRPALAATPGSSRRPRTSVRGLTILSLGALLLGLAWFAFTSVSVQVLVEPTPASLALRGGWPALTLGNHFLLRPGEYRVEAELEGYALSDAIVRVGSDNQRFAFAMQRLPGRLELTSDPSGAEVFLDGQSVGTTPLRDLRVESGTHTLRLEAERHQSLEQTVAIQGGDALQQLELTLLPNWAEVSIGSVPAGARVRIDGEDRGETPASVEVEAGTHSLRLTLDGYETEERELIVVAREPQSLTDIVLAEADGRVRVVSQPTGATLTLDGRYAGKTPVEVELDPSRAHELSLSKVGYRTVSRTVDVAADATSELRVTLPAELGEIEVRATPADAEVWVDGKRVGVSPGPLELSAEPHQIELRKAGFVTASTRVTPRPGLRKLVELTLAPEPVRTADGTPAPVEPTLPDRIRTRTGQELVLLRSPGVFEMGSGRREQGRRSNETQRKVELRRSFYLGTREITNAEFRAFDAAHDSGDFKGLPLDGDDRPAVRIAWSRAAAFCNWLSSKEGLPEAYEKRGDVFVLREPVGTGYRLPTEAEWAFAARYAGYSEAQRYPWGNSLPVAPRSGNYADRNASGTSPAVLESYDDGFGGPAPVGSFPATPLGLFDLGGNAAEWVSDLYAIRPPNGEVDPKGPAAGEYHLIRGSSWNQASLTQLRLAHRDYGEEGREDVGFRIARYAE